LRHCARPTRAEYRPCSTRTEPPIRPSFLRYRSKLSLSNRARFALVTQNYTRNCKSIFGKTQSNILLSRQIGTNAALRWLDRRFTRMIGWIFLAAACAVIEAKTERTESLHARPPIRQSR